MVILKAFIFLVLYLFIKFFTCWGFSGNIVGMKKYKTIYLDMDGVLAAFCKAVVKQLNAETGKSVTLDQIIERQEWNLENMWDLTATQWWKTIDKDPIFWLNIEPFPWAYKLYEEMHKYADGVVILSAPSRSPNCIDHKKQWLKKLGINPSNAIFEKNKYEYASPDVLLIDDAPHNIDPFIDLGGNAVKVPSDWNTKSLTYEMVIDTITDYINEQN